MDTALVLKQKFDRGEIKNYKQAAGYLKKSGVVQDLLGDFDETILNLLGRLAKISEIPFTYKLERVQTWVTELARLSYCEDGFSVTGKSDDILSCYNSMITSVLIRMKYTEVERITKGIEWILKYQNVERGLENKWSGSRILKYGGCMKSTPCYIGVVKAMIALSDFKKQDYYKPDKKLEQKLNEGLDYILEHQIYKRRSNGRAITKDITKLTYPFSYKTNLLEILRLLQDNKLDLDLRSEPAKEYLRSKRQKAGFWKVNSTYLPAGWVPIDRPKEPGEWISYEIEKVLNVKAGPDERPTRGRAGRF